MTDYRTILVYAGPPMAPAASRLALRLAEDFDARVVAVACSGTKLWLAPGLIEAGNEQLARHVMDKIDAASTALEQLQELAADSGFHGIELRRLNGRAARELPGQLMFADLTVMAQGLAQRKARDGWRTLPEVLLRDAARAVLVVPDSQWGATCGRHVVIAWDGSPASARAVHAALPILKRAAVVEAVTYSTDDGFSMPGELDALAAYLTTHGIYTRTRFLRARRNVDIGDALLAHVKTVAADLLVLGGYGHSRMRELLLGSASQTVMREMRVPALFAH